MGKPAAELAVVPSGVTAVSLDVGPILAADALGCDKVDVVQHFKIALVDVSKNMDKYFAMQTLRDGDKYFFATHWGRTGTEGQKKYEGPLDSVEAYALLARKFKEKTGNDVESVAAGTFAGITGKYDLVTGDTGRRPTVAAGTWQYY